MPNIKDEKYKRKIPKILLIFPLIAAISYLLYLFNMITLMMSSIIASFSFVMLAVLLILVERKGEKESSEKNTKKSLFIIGTIFLLFVIILILLFVRLSNWSDEDNEHYIADVNKDFDKFIGSWEGFWTTITFSADGICSYEMYYGTWELKNGKLVTYMSSEYMPEPTKISYDYTFSNDGKTLTLTDEDGGVNVYMKK